MSISKRLSKNQIDIVTIFTILFIVFLGSFVRLTHVWTANFPLNDGGLFSVMTEDLIENNYRLPEFSSYNSLNIPYAYPPFPLYIAAILVEVGDLVEISVIQYLPALISVLTIPIFYLFSRDFTNSKTQSVFATVAFAFVPRSFIWLIMGGGLTRAPGYLFALLALWQIYLMDKQDDRKHILLAILFCSLTVLSHPEAALFVLSSALVFFLFLQRNKVGIKRSILVAVGVILFTSPWWLTMLVRYGISPLLASGTSTAASLWSRIIWPWIALLTFDLTEEIWIKLFAVLGLIGMFWCVSKKRFLLPAWIIVVLAINTRGHLSYAMIPLCIMAGLGAELVLNALTRFRGKTFEFDNKNENWFGVVMNNTGTKIAFGFILIHGMASAYAYPYVSSSEISALPVLGSGERQAMAWISENTSEADSFISISDQPWWLDPTSEWFPALAKRNNLNTVQGTEWLPGGEFHDRWRVYDELQQCSCKESDCLNNWREEAGKDFSHVYVKKVNSTSALWNSLRDSAEFLLIFENDQVVVYQYLKDTGVILGGVTLRLNENDS